MVAPGSPVPSVISMSAAPMPRPKRDVRPWALAILLAGVAMLGGLVQWLPSRGVDGSELQSPHAQEKPGFQALRGPSAQSRSQEETETLPEPTRPLATASERERANDVIRQAGKLLRDRKHEEAIRLLDAEHALLAKDGRAYYYLGKALLLRKDATTARDFLHKAIDLDPALADAYFSYAEAAEAEGDLESALGGMRAFIHLSKDADPYRLRIAQARSAIWEWESQLGRGPWGPTKGIPPGFSAEEIKRDGRGVGIKMQKVDSLRPDGTMDAEMKAQKKFKIYSRE